MVSKFDLISATAFRYGEKERLETVSHSHVLQVVNELGWGGVAAQTVHIDGIASASGKDITGEANGLGGTGFRNVNDGPLAWMSQHNRNTETDPVTGKSLKDDNVMEKFAERAFKVSNDIV